MNTAFIANTDDQYLTFEVPEEGTYTNDAGDPFWFDRGARIGFGQAARFDAFRPLIQEQLEASRRAAREMNQR